MFTLHVGRLLLLVHILLLVHVIQIICNSMRRKLIFFVKLVQRLGKRSVARRLDGVSRRCCSVHLRCFGQRLVYLRCTLTDVIILILMCGFGCLGSSMRLLAAINRVQLIQHLL
ncbi:hypothetical protein PR002_g32906, partial [Phytophthora rubi]